MRALNEKGLACREWASQVDTKIINDLKQYWCDTNIDSEDCKCLNRGLNKNFNNAIESVNAIDNSSCWFKPCMDTNVYLTTETDRKCEINVCQTIYSLINNDVVKLHDIKANTNCNSFNVTEYTTIFNREFIMVIFFFVVSMFLF